MLLWKPGTVVVNRPKVYFDPRGSAPDAAELRICPAPGLDVEEWVRQTTRAVKEKTELARK